MPRRVGVIFVHGISANELNYSLPMQKKLCELLPHELHSLIKFEEVFWARHVRPRQAEFMKDVRAADPGVVENRLRQFFVEGMGDAAAYQKTRDRANSIYYKVHGDLLDALKNLERRGLTDSPLIFVGHSLGTHIISSFAWDINKLKQRSQGYIDARPEAKELWNFLNAENRTPMRRLDTFAGLVTMGSNIPLFTFTFGGADVFPITMAPSGTTFTPAFPGPALTPELSAKSRWLNFYSPRDVLGYPLKPLNGYFDAVKCLEDISVNTERAIDRTVPYWSNVAAHMGYWTNPVVVRRTADLIRDMIET
jgi:pimeloyl-ACP methyl ester carboxylesterase